MRFRAGAWPIFLVTTTPNREGCEGWLDDSLGTIAGSSALRATRSTKWGVDTRAPCA